MASTYCNLPASRFSVAHNICLANKGTPYMKDKEKYINLNI